MNSRVLELTAMPRHFFKELGEDYVDRYQWRFVPTPGAYLVKQEDIKKGQSITLTRNRDWWAKDNKFLRYRFNYDKIRLTVIRDTAKSFETFKKGELNGFGMNLPEYYYDKLPNDHELVTKGYVKKYIFYNDVPRPTYGLWINCSKPLLDNRDIRIGINYATNWKKVIDLYFRGDFTRMNTTADGYGEFTHPTLKSRSFDVEKALAHFEKAGFINRDSNGILVNDAGQRLSFTLTTGYPSLQDILTILKEEAIKAGLDFGVEVLDGTTAWKKVQEKKHDIQFSAFNVSPEMYPRYWETYHSVNAYDRPFLEDGSVNPDRKVKTQTNNLQVIALPELDKRIEQYRASENAEEMMRLAFEMEEILHQNGSFVPGFYLPFYRTALWRWVHYPEDFNVKLSRYTGEYFLGWIDTDERMETLKAKRKGITFEPSITIHDQYKIVRD